MSEDYKKRHWYLSEEDYKSLSQPEIADWWCFLWDNGITSPSNAEFQMYAARSQDFYKPSCPNCGEGPSNSHAYSLSEFRWICKKCAHQYTITSSTYIANSKLSMSQLWRFSWLVGDMKITNSIFLAQDLAITQKTAWWLLEALRRSRKDEIAPKKFKTGSEVLHGLDQWDVRRYLTRIAPKEKKYIKVLPPKQEAAAEIIPEVSKPENAPAKKRGRPKKNINTNLAPAINLQDPINNSKHDAGADPMQEPHIDDLTDSDIQNVINDPELQNTDNHPMHVGARKKPDKEFYARIRKANDKLSGPQPTFAPPAPEIKLVEEKDPDILARAEKAAEKIIQDAIAAADEIVDDEPIDIKEIIRRQSEYRPGQS